MCLGVCLGDSSRSTVLVLIEVPLAQRKKKALSEHFFGPRGPACRSALLQMAASVATQIQGWPVRTQMDLSGVLAQQAPSDLLQEVHL